MTKMVKRLGFVLALKCLLACTGGCETSKIQTPTEEATSPPVVAVTNYPLSFFAKQVAGPWIDVTFPVAKDLSQQGPSGWQPATATVMKMQHADKVFINGGGFESWLPMVTLSESSIVDTSQSIQDEWVEIAQDIAHQHGPEGEKTETETAYSTWVNPDLAIRQARTITDNLIALDPAHKAEYEANFLLLEEQLKALEQLLIERSPFVREGNLIAAQPVYQYLAQATGAKFRNLNWPLNSAIGPQQWAQLDALLEKQKTQGVLWSGKLDEQTAQEFQKRGLHVIRFDTLASAPAEGDYVSHMKANIERLGPVATK